MVQIIPSVLATTEEQYQRDITKLNTSLSLSGGWVHIDFADNEFVQNKTIEPEVIKQSPTNFRKEAHLMVIHPKEWIERLVDAGFERIIFHLESQDNVEELIDYIKNKGLEVGIALKNETAIENLEPFSSKIDVILLMSIVAGFQGQSFIPKTLDKIGVLKAKGWNVKIGVDGSIKDSNIREVVEAGADFVIVGSYFLNGELEENIENIWEALRLRSG